MLTQIKKLIKDEEAPTAVEYALMVACIAVVVVVGAYFLGNTTNNKFQSVSTSVATPH